MMNKLIMPLLLSLLSVFCVNGLVQAEGGKHFSAELTAATGGPKQVETKAAGLASFTFSPDGHLTYELSGKNLENVYMAHLHLAEKDGYGHIIAWLYPPHHQEKAVPLTGTINNVFCQDSITAADLLDVFAGKTVKDLVDAIEAGKVSVIIHTTRYRAGELKGLVH